MAGVDAVRRCRLLADAYGMSGRDRGRLVEVARIRNERAWHLMRHRAQTEGGGWQRMWDEGIGAQIRRRSVWLEQQAEPIHRAILG